MKLLVIGSGGREHALAWKATHSPLADLVYVAPGNGGTATEPGLANAQIGVDAIDELVAFARDHEIGLSIVGPEAPLVAGIVDAFEAAGLPCFGPRKAPAQLEGSKAFTKAFLARHDIPTAAYESFTELQPALDHLDRVGVPIVIKADGLAAGKGVILAQDMDTARSALRDMLGEGRFGDAGDRVVIEEFLTGEEASFIVMADGTDCLPMASSQDHKARDDGDRGPNTGGMGAYSPAPVITPEMHERVMEQVIRPTLEGLAAEGMPYRGFLYAGLMIGEDGLPRVLEYNCRFGDPETQPILMRLQSDLVAHCLAALEGRLGTMQTQWDPRVSLGVVMAAGGYPDAYERGNPISGLDGVNAADLKVFHAGTRYDGSKTLTAGGRVLCVTALGDSVPAAKARAYEGVHRIQWKDCYYRTDIGHRAIARETTGG